RKVDKIKPKLKLTAKEIRDLFYRAFKEVCLEIYPDWDHKTLTIASSNDEEKMSLHISTFGLRLKNIAKVAVFTELVRKKLPIDLQEKYIVDNIANKSSFSLRMLNTPSGKLI
ncbi:15360_t:CDS:1, partial [Entrophospora sp. SA101]